MTSPLPPPWAAGKIFVNDNGCWILDSIPHGNGYVEVWVGAFKIFAHRASWAFYNGPIPEGMNILHSCDTPSCINPEHLFSGTQAENVTDMVTKGRANYIRAQLGEDNPYATTTREQAIEIKRLLSEGIYTQSGIGEMVGVSRDVVKHIKSGKNWSHI